MRASSAAGVLRADALRRRLRILEGRRRRSRNDARACAHRWLHPGTLDATRSNCKKHGLESRSAGPLAHRADRKRNVTHTKERLMATFASVSSGVGNCAASLVQGVHYYRDADPAHKVPGLMHVEFGPYHAATSSSSRVRRGRQEGRSRPPRPSWQREQHPSAVTCRRSRCRCSAATPRRPGQVLPETIEESDEEPSTSSRPARGQVDVLICYLPVGSEDAARFYAQCAIDAGVAFVNALPVFIADARVGEEVRGPACRSWATTSSRRSAPPSRTGCWPAVRGPRRRNCRGRCSSTSAAHGLQEHARARAPGSRRRSARPSR